MSYERVFDPGVYMTEVKAAADYIKWQLIMKSIDFQPEFALTLGSGLGDLAEQIKPLLVIPYSQIPHFPLLTVDGHKGEMVIGHLAGVPVIGLSGRKHFYEVTDQLNGIKQAVFLAHVVANLGAKIYFSTNAAGGLNLAFQTGDLMMIASHIGFFMPNPLAGAHLDFGGNPRFQPQTEAEEYQPELRSLFRQAAEEVGENEHLYEGFFGGLPGPTYESRAESLALRTLGADAVGMSVIPEIIVAANRGMRSIGVSIITNLIDKFGNNAASHPKVKAILDNPVTRQRLARTFSKFFELYRKKHLPPT